MKSARQYKTGLVLSGGAARGFAHPGVIKALQEFGIEPEIISGASAGAIAGCLYADGYEPEEILELFKGKRFLDFTRLRIAKTGILEVTGLKKLLSKNLRAKEFQSLKKELVVAVTNYRTGRAEYITDGNLLETVMASASIPVIFTPIKLDGDYYVDGGITDNFPIEPIKKRCEKTIGVDVNPVGEESGKMSLLSISIRSFQLAVSSEMVHKRDEVDLFIEPMELTRYSLIDTKRGPEMYRIGYEKAINVLKSNKFQ